MVACEIDGALDGVCGVFGAGRVGAERRSGYVDEAQFGQIPVCRPFGDFEIEQILDGGVDRFVGMGLGVNAPVHDQE